MNVFEKIDAKHLKKSQEATHLSKTNCQHILTENLNMHSVS